MLRQVCSSLRCANICSSPASSCPVSIFPASAVHPRSSTEDLMKCCEGKDESKAVRLWGGGSKHHCKQLRLCPLDVIGLRKLYATWKAIWWRPKETGNREDNTTAPWPESILKLTNSQGGKGVESQELADYRELSVHSGEHHRLSTFFSFLQTLSCYSSYSSSLPLIFLERVPCPPFLTIYPLYSLWVKILEEKDNCSGV